MSSTIRAVAEWKDGTLTLSNKWLERRLTAQVGGILRTDGFVNRLTGREYARRESREFSFRLNGREVTTSDLSLRTLDIQTGEPTEAIVYLEDSTGGLAVQVHYQVYADHPVLRKWLVFCNRGGQDVSLRDLDWEDVNLLVDSAGTAEVWWEYMTRRDKSVVVTMDDTVLLINDVEHGEGFVVASEAPGPLKRLEAYARPGRIAVGYNRDDETIFERILGPGEEFPTAAAFILPFAQPVPQDVIDGEYAQFVEEHLTICPVERVPTIMMNTWVPHMSGIDRAVLLEQIDRAAELGVDAYQIDDGWYDYMGDWNHDPAKFPQGLEEIADRVRARGMRFGLWMAVATVNEASQIARQHPEWLARDRDGEPNQHPMPGALTMCLDSGYGEVIRDKVESIIGRLGVELLKLDLSATRNLYSPGRYPGCHAQGHGHRTHDDSHLRIVERLFDLVREIKHRHPDCLVDLSYELYGVMDGTDLALTQVADQNWFTNLTSPNEINLRREIYQRGRVTRPWTLNFGGAVLEHPNAPRYGLFSALTSHAVFWGDLTSLDDETRAHYKRWFTWAKAERAYSDFYRYYQVSNVFPVPDGISNRDFRHAIPTLRYGLPTLGIHPPAFVPESEHPGEFWDGAARLNPQGEGPIFLFRPAACGFGFFQLRIPWVQRNAHYSLQDVDEGRELGIFSGEALIEQGLEIQISEPLRAKVVVLRLAEP